MEGTKKVDYDELTLNPLLAEIETEVDNKPTKRRDTDKVVTGTGKSKRYWTSKEEERFFEIWGRDNWRLTRHGKNSIYFAKWSDELKQLYNIEVTGNEVQAKVNQFRCRFRQVTKQGADKKWKKFDVVDKILKNEYRPDDAEPIPQEALQNNRDIKPEELVTTISQPPQPPQQQQQRPQPHPPLSASPAGVITTNNAGDGNEEQQTENDISTITLPEQNNTGEYYNNSNSNLSNQRQNYSVELFTDQMDDDMKKDFQSSFQQFQQFQQYQQLETQPQQQQQQYAPPVQNGTNGTTTAMVDGNTMTAVQFQQQQQVLQQNYNNQQQVLNQTEKNVYLIQQQEQQQQPQQVPIAYDQLNENGNNNNDALKPTPTNLLAQTTANSQLPNSTAQQHNFLPAHSTPVPQKPNPTTIATAKMNLATNNNHSNNSSTLMQHPRTVLHAHQTRKRRNMMLSSSTASSATTTKASTDHLSQLNHVHQQQSTTATEAVYLEEVRKKNIILEEQTVISQKRLLLEERKVVMLEQFLPKYLDMQDRILSKLQQQQQQQQQQHH